MKKLQPNELRKKTDKELSKMKKTLQVALVRSYASMKKEDARHDSATIKRNIARINTIENERREK